MTQEHTAILRDRYQELFERSADAILIIEGETFVDCNQAAVDMLGCASKSEVLQTHPSELSPEHQPDGRDSFQKANEMIALARERGSHRFEWSHRRKNGECFPVEVLLTVVDRGSVPVLHVVWRDLSDRWRLEQQLRQSQKMEAVGKLAGGIAHDFNNLLVGIFANCEAIDRSTREPTAAAATAQIREASHRAADLVRQLMTFSRQRPPSKQVVDLQAAVHALEPLLRRTLGEHIELTVRSSGPCPVKMDPSQIDQVVMNLASNARDAMPDGGRLTIELRVVDGSECGEKLGRYAQISFTDTGTGMSDEVQARAFEPFFTTKKLGEGTGFGLATVYSIAEQHGGLTRIESELGAGTRVCLCIPRWHEAEVPPPVRATAESSDQNGTETLLFVEDDPLIGPLMARELRRRGYVVHFAKNGALALELIHDVGPEKVDLIVSDVVMPEMTGPTFVQHLRDEWQQVPVLFVSGYAGQELRALDEDVELLSKPYTPGVLATRVRRVLASAQA